VIYTSAEGTLVVAVSADIECKDKQNFPNTNIGKGKIVDNKYIETDFADFEIIKHSSAIHR